MSIEDFLSDLGYCVFRYSVDSVKWDTSSQSQITEVTASPPSHNWNSFCKMAIKFLRIYFSVIAMLLKLP